MLEPVRGTVAAPPAEKSVGLSVPWVVALIVVAQLLGTLGTHVTIGMLVRDDGVSARELGSLYARIEHVERAQATAPPQGTDRRQAQEEEDACLSSDEVAFQAMRIANAVSRVMNNTLPQIHEMQTQIADLEAQQRQHGGWTVQDDGLVVPSQASGYPGSRPATEINHCRYSEFVDEPIGGDVCPTYGPLTPAVAGFVAAIQMGLPGMYVLRCSVMPRRSCCRRSASCSTSTCRSSPRRRTRRCASLAPCPWRRPASWRSAGS